jgi:hypothetical protein
MKKFIWAIALCFACANFAQADLIITGLVDPDGGTGDALELFALDDISDLSIYGIETVSNGNDDSNNSPDSTFATGSLNAGDFYYVTSDDEDFTRFFGFDADEDLNININGNDAVLLYQNGTVIDTVLSASDGTDIHGDGWIYRNDDEGPNTSFSIAEWTVAIDSLGSSNDSTNAESQTPAPLGTYSVSAVPEPATAVLFGLAGLGLCVVRRR